LYLTTRNYYVESKVYVSVENVEENKENRLIIADFVAYMQILHPSLLVRECFEVREGKWGGEERGKAC
jgi:hypothetical protein